MVGGAGARVVAGADVEQERGRRRHRQRERHPPAGRGWRRRRADRVRAPGTVETPTDLVGHVRRGVCAEDLGVGSRQRRQAFLAARLGRQTRAHVGRLRGRQIAAGQAFDQVIGDARGGIGVWLMARLLAGDRRAGAWWAGGRGVGVGQFGQPRPQGAQALAHARDRHAHLGRDLLERHAIDVVQDGDGQRRLRLAAEDAREDPARQRAGFGVAAATPVGPSSPPPAAAIRNTSSSSRSSG